MTESEYATTIAKRHGFASVEGMRRFLLACYGKSATRKITVTDIEGRTVEMLPTDEAFNYEPEKNV